MAIKFTAVQRRKLAEALDHPHETLEDATGAILELLDAFWKERALYVVVGQLRGTRTRLSVPPGDPEAIKVALGVYSTEGDAKSAAESLVFSTASGDTFATWYLPLFHGTPAELHTAQKEKYKLAAVRAKEQRSERIHAQIEQARRDAQERADAIKRGEITV